MAEDPIDVAELLAAYRQVARPSSAVKRRIVRELDESPPTHARTWTIAAVAVAAAAVLVLAWRGDWLAIRAEPAREQAPYQGGAPRSEHHAVPAQPPLPAVPPEAVPPAIVPVAPPSVVPAPSRPASPRAGATAEPPHGSAAPEIALLERARIHLAAGRAEAALAIVDRHALEFPRGQLGEERDALRVLASCELDDHRTAALELRREFLRRHPRSTYADRVRAACGDRTHEANIP